MFPPLWWLQRRKRCIAAIPGDGKIFAYNVEDVIKARTGEEGFAALQDDVYELLPCGRFLSLLSRIDAPRS